MVYYNYFLFRSFLKEDCYNTNRNIRQNIKSLTDFLEGNKLVNSAGIFYATVCLLIIRNYGNYISGWKMFCILLFVIRKCDGKTGLILQSNSTVQ